MRFLSKTGTAEKEGLASLFKRAKTILKKGTPELASAIARPVVAVATGASILGTVTTVAPAAIGASLVALGIASAGLGLARIARKEQSPEDPSEPKKEYTPQKRRADYAQTSTFALAAAASIATMRKEEKIVAESPLYYQTAGDLLSSNRDVQSVLTCCDESIPAGTRIHLSQQGMNIAVADTYTSLYPDAAGLILTPTEYDSRFSWDQSPACYDPNINRIEIFRYVYNGSEELTITIHDVSDWTGGEAAYNDALNSSYAKFAMEHPALEAKDFNSTADWHKIPSDEIVEHTLHELGHAVQYNMEEDPAAATYGDGVYTFEEFQKIFAEELARVSHEDFEEYKYFFEPDGGEAYAELYAGLHGDKGNAELMTILPESTRFIENYEAHLCGKAIPYHAESPTLEWLANATPLGDLMHHLEGTIGGWDMHFSPSFNFTVATSAALVTWMRCCEGQDLTNVEYLVHKAKKAASTVERLGEVAKDIAKDRSVLKTNLFAAAFGTICSSCHNAANSSVEVPLIDSHQLGFLAINGVIGYAAVFGVEVLFEAARPQKKPEVPQEAPRAPH